MFKGLDCGKGRLTLFAAWPEVDRRGEVGVPVSFFFFFCKPRSIVALVSQEDDLNKRVHEVKLSPNKMCSREPSCCSEPVAILCKTCTLMMMILAV